MKNPELTPQQIGDLRLLELADILDHTNYYGQDLYMRRCGTPSCALGHWAHAHPDRWVFTTGIPTLNEFVGRTSSWSAMWEFCISEHEAVELFGGDGCNKAGHDAHKAANFIRAFVIRRNS